MDIIKLLIAVSFIGMGLVGCQQNTKHWKAFLIGGLIIAIAVIVSAIISTKNP